jgi:hypothetical protein
MIRDSSPGPNDPTDRPLCAPWLSLRVQPIDPARPHLARARSTLCRLTSCSCLLLRPVTLSSASVASCYTSCRFAISERPYLLHPSPLGSAPASSALCLSVGERRVLLLTLLRRRWAHLPPPPSASPVGAPASSAPVPYKMTKEITNDWRNHKITEEITK